MMKLFNSTNLLFAIVLSWLALIPAQAEQKKQLGVWDVHYIALPTTLLDPTIASQYRIERSKYNGLVNISVLNSKDQVAQQVQISGEAKNLLGQIKQLSFVEVKEGAAVYYIAQYGYQTEQMVSFTIQISQGSQSQELKFNHTFYPD
ncbi:MAG: DUF4426 domain-containing protein [Rheinheimera sp.]|nr:DUF4426 domain-containing protein [Rheinheimera sp.]